MHTFHARDEVVQGGFSAKKKKKVHLLFGAWWVDTSVVCACLVVGLTPHPAGLFSRTGWGGTRIEMTSACSALLNPLSLMTTTSTLKPNPTSTQLDAWLDFDRQLYRNPIACLLAVPRASRVPLPLPLHSPPTNKPIPAPQPDHPTPHSGEQRSTTRRRIDKLLLQGQSASSASNCPNRNSILPLGTRGRNVLFLCPTLHHSLLSVHRLGKSGIANVRRRAGSRAIFTDGVFVVLGNISKAVRQEKSRLTADFTITRRPALVALFSIDIQIPPSSK